MSFARKVWKLLVAVKDGLVLLFMLMFFGALYALLSMRPAPHEVREGALLVKLDGVVVEEPQAVDPLALIASRGVPTREHRARDVIRAIDGAVKDEKIKAVVLDLDYFLGGGQVTLTEIGEALDRVRAARKPVLVHAIAYTADSMQLAAHGSEVWLDPMGGAMIAGPGGRATFYGGLAERLGVKVHVFKAGLYKSAVEPYTLTKFSDPAKQDLAGLFDAMWTTWQDDVGKARPKAQVARMANDPVAAITATNGDPARAALALGLVDKLGTREAFAARVRQIVGKDDDAPDDPAAFAATSYEVWGKANKPGSDGKAIGIITIAGNIVDGDAGPGTAGGDRIADLLDEALSKDLAALVIRVDSPGGTVTGAERIRQAILRHKEKGIPIIASMGNLAASGGYWVTTPATTVFADPSTVTGSIGVFLVVPTFEETLAKVGVTQDDLSTTPLAGQPDIIGGFSPEMEAVLQAQTLNVYDQFLSIAGKARNKNREQMLQLAEGRVWAGGPARQAGLVDRFGGLDDALAFAAAQAKLKDGDWHADYLEAKPTAFQEFVQGMTSNDEADAPVTLAQFATARRNAMLGATLEDLARMMGTASIEARCLVCPPPARLLRNEADFPGWLAAFRALTTR
ncbi:signal peptide peptidase SppA [Croceicoccus sp. BE223]|uniref:signal peptide peptidase SppA n=1 Tax=Croceicoccus sp. BE223 TaxID=2817716 RepID=UPI002865C6B0|nr:signal peptide peptidase SppA [Croceicoccus sp. BE223]MDR7101855.1 protease-4 [Croceicoccus sp. BE223]